MHYHFALGPANYAAISYPGPPQRHPVVLEGT